MSENEFWNSTPRKMYMLIQAWNDLHGEEKSNQDDLSWLMRLT